MIEWVESCLKTTVILKERPQGTTDLSADRQENPPKGIGYSLGDPSRLYMGVMGKGGSG